MAEANDPNLAYNQVAINVANSIFKMNEHQRDLPYAKKTKSEVTKLFHQGNKMGLGVYLENERLGGNFVSPELEFRAKKLNIEFEHLGTTIGTVIHNINLKQKLSKEQVEVIRETLVQRKVIFFRNQILTEDEQVNFGRYFGALDAFPFAPPAKNPYLYHIRHGHNRPGNINLWHTDVTWMEKPSLGSIAQCIEIPRWGGDTCFSDSHAVYLGLPNGIQAKLKDIHGINDYRNFLGGKKHGLPEKLRESIKAQIPFGVSHPLLRTHDENGKTALYLHTGFLRHDSLYNAKTGEKMDVNEAKRLIRFLAKQFERPEYQCRFQWKQGSIAFWDNRACQHYATSDYFPYKRTLRRITVSSSVRPYYNPLEDIYDPNNNNNHEHKSKM